MALPDHLRTAPPPARTGRPGTTALAALAVVGEQQGGAWTHAQARAAGLTTGRIRWLRRTRWASPYRAVYVDARQLRSVTPAGRHVLLAAARILTSGRGAVASHRTAALVHGLAVLGPPPRVPVLTRPPTSPDERSGSANLKVASLEPFSWVRRRGVAVTSLARTVGDIGRTCSLQHAVVTLDAAWRAGLDEADLSAVVQTCRSWPGGGRLIEAVGLGDPRAETPIESLTRLRYRDFGLPTPQSQIEVYAPDGTSVGLVDFLFADSGVVGEADGMLKYTAPGVLREEKRRQERLVDCGFEVLRNDWDEALLTNRAVIFQGRAVRAFGRAAGRTPVPGVRFRVVPLAELRRRQRRVG